MAKIHEKIKKSKGYLGNDKLKKVGEKIEWTPETLAEFAKCKKSPQYFAENYVKIVSLDKGLVKFKLRPFQQQIFDSVVDNRFTICKIPRQSGKTVAVMAVLLWYVLFHEHYRIAVLANKADQARKVLALIKKSYEYLPKWLQQGVVEWNKGNIELENKSSIITAGTSESTVRGDSINLLYLDEYAHVEPHVQEAFITSVYPTITSGTDTKIVITSTPKGLEGFHAIWKKSVAGKNSYHRIEVHWSQIPGRDENWKKETIDNTSQRQFDQEFECNFLGSSDTLINGQILEGLPTSEPVDNSEDHSLRVFCEPEARHQYVITVDVARGVGGDYSAFTVIDVTYNPYRVVASFYNNTIPPITFPMVIHQTATQYNNAAILVEINDIGGEIVDALHWDLEYENILCTHMNKGRVQQVGVGFGNGALSLGLRMTKSVKQIGCSNLKTLVEKGKLYPVDYRIIHELSTFVEKGNTFRAEDGSHDDLAMCLVSFAWFATQPYFTELYGSDTKRNIIEDQAKALEENVIPFGFVSDGVNDYEFEEEYGMDEALLSAETKAAAEEILRRYRIR